MEDDKKVIHQHFYERVDVVAGRDATVNYPDSREYIDMSLDELYQVKKQLCADLFEARKQIFISLPAIAFFILSAFVAYSILSFTLFGIVQKYQSYFYVWMAAMLFVVYGVSQKVREYGPLIFEYKQEIAYIEKVITHKKIRSRR